MSGTSRIARYGRDPRVLVAVPLFILITISVVYYFVQRARELSPTALSSRLLLFVLWNINLILILGIVFVLLRGIVKLLLERQRGLLGSQFRTKLVVTYVVTSLLPIIVLFVVATDLLRVSIDRWFNTPVHTILSNSAEIAETSQARVIESARAAAREVAATAQQEPATVLEHVRRFHPVQLVGIYRDGLALKLMADPRAPVHEINEPPARFFTELTSRGSAEMIDAVADGKWIRVGVRIAGTNDAALAGVFIPDRISRLIDQNIVARVTYEQLDAQRPELKASQTLLFLTVTLSILFGTLWTAIFVSRRITVPVLALARGTSTLAAGDYGHRIDVRATDEFGTLIDSFNRMSEQLEAQRSALTASNRDLQDVNSRLDEERAYLETVLDSVSTGVLAFSGELRLLSSNRAARTILQMELDEGARLDERFAQSFPALAAFLQELRDREPRPREITITRGGEVRYLEVSAAPLGGQPERGWVVALEDSTQLVQAQKLAAWSEAARRIAHEIKNPLTPIQLSAQRIARKVRMKDPQLERIVEEGCQTIVSEVGQLKAMVDEFSRFARMPAVHLRQTAIAPVVDEVVRLYRDVKPGVSVRGEAPADLELVIDREQIRRALINLLDNAIEATAEGEILVRARRERGKAVLEVSDPGRGVPPADKENLFVPYFSTKKEGTGLGLAIVHRIVNDHDGRITVHDNTPAGTRFEIELPL